MRNFGFIKCLVCLIAIGLILTQKLNAQEFIPEFDVQALSSVISVDGDKTDWEAIEELPMNPVSGMEFYNGEEDCRLSYKVTWDTEKIYLLVDITDPEAIIYGDENITEAPEPYSVDNIEFFLDLDNSDNAKMDNKNDFQIRMPRKSEYIPGAEGWPNGLGTIPSMMNSPGSTSEYDHQKGFVEGFGFEISKTETETGWILEAAFPWEVLLKVDENLTPADMADGTQIGVMLQYQDRDALDVKDRTKFLNLEEGSWNNPAGWGTMTLKGGNTSTDQGLIAIDGEIDEIWTDAPKFEIAVVSNIADHEPHQVTDENDLSGYFKAMWDEEHLYILGQVKDDALVITDSKNNSDNFHIYFDPENNKEETEPGHMQVGYGYNNSEHYGRIAPGWNNPPYYEFAAKETDSGYIVEFKLLADSIRLDKLETGMMIGIDVKLNDVDDAVTINRDGLSWIDKDDLAWRDAWRYGTIELIEGGHVVGYTKPATPDNFSNTTDGNTVTFTWDKAENALGYYLFQNDEIVAGVTENSVTIDDLKFLKLYSFELQAYGKGDVRSYFTEPLDVILALTELESPEISGETTENKVTISWEKIEYAEGYKIYQDGQEVADITKNKYEISNLSDGTFNFSVVAYNGEIISEESNVIPAVIAGIADLNSELITINPNPVKDFITINCSHNIRRLTIFDIYGKRIPDVSNFDNSSKLDMSKLRAGLYVISIKTDIGYYTHKVIRE
jgi:hypothetical protein